MVSRDTRTQYSLAGCLTIEALSTKTRMVCVDSTRRRIDHPITDLYLVLMIAHLLNPILTWPSDFFIF